jgi:hypothetical protein
MGRHSLPDDDEPAAGTEVSAAERAVDDEPRGRHSWRPGAEQSVVLLERPATPGADTGPVPVVAHTALVAEVADTAPVPAVTDTAAAASVDEAAPEAGRKPSGTHADLALLSADRGLRMWAGGAVVAPFAMYALLLAVLGRLDVLVLWVWIPVIVAGVAFGAVLDSGYRKAARSRSAAADADDVSG